MISLTNSSDSQEFMARFCELPEKFSHNSTRPLPQKRILGVSAKRFPEVNKELFIAEKDGADVGEFVSI